MDLIRARIGSGGVPRFHLTNPKRLLIDIVRDDNNRVICPFLNEDVAKFAIQAKRVTIVTEQEFDRLLKKYPDSIKYTDQDDAVTAFMVPEDEDIQVKTKTSSGGPSAGECFPGGVTQHWYMSDDADQILIAPILVPKI
jgi:hypothetical protein